MPVDEAGRLHATGYSRASSLPTEREGNYEAAVGRLLASEWGSLGHLAIFASKLASHSGFVAETVGATT